ncbi:MAG: nuclear transport factor 2 family protein [Chitinophagaceae bacterium]
MRIIFLSASVILFYLVSCSPAHKLQGTSGNDKDVAALKKLEYDWLVAEFKLDTAAIAPMMDECFISVGLNGVSGKQEDLKGMYDNISSRLKNDHIVDSFFFDDFRVQMHDHTAIVTFFTVTSGHIKNVPFENRRTRFYDVWIKRKGQWKAVSSQGTPVL